MQQLNEGLAAGDLRMLVDNIFEIDSFASKMGDDKEIVVLAFTVKSQKPATDLVDFVENGYDFVLDADSSPGELSDGKYKVFVELQRDSHVAEHISDLLYGVKKLTGVEDFKFRYYKSFDSKDAVREMLEEVIPNDPTTYEESIKERKMESYEHFFAKGRLEKVVMEGDLLRVKKIYADPLQFKVIRAGTPESILESIEEKINVNEWAEIIFLTKYFGDFNITKFGNKLMFEDKGHAVLMERL
jgi:hypothetical protein